MLNDLGDKYEGQDDSEYRFSDDEVSYEVEPESPKPSGPGGGGPHESIMARLSRSKRMLISGVVFIVLVFIVYKMVAPTTAVTPSTDMTAAQAPTTSAQNVASTNPAQAPVNQPTPVTHPVQAAAQVQQPVMQAPQQPAQQAMPVAEQVMQQQPTAAAQQLAQMAQQPPQQLPQQLPQQFPQQPLQQTVANMPAVIPVQPPTPTYNQSVNTPMTPAVNAAYANLSANSDRAYNQFQADYAQKINEYAVQNKVLQDQVTTLNARVATMESQLHQLVQALTHQGQNATESRPPPPPISHGSEPRLAYSVQAIIPGRAWLRSDNGETVTVAEGDVIKDLGRVSKIDPYDGIVEINTGTKMLSLSYGNGA